MATPIQARGLRGKPPKPQPRGKKRKRDESDIGSLEKAVQELVRQDTLFLLTL